MSSMEMQRKMMTLEKHKFSLCHMFEILAGKDFCGQ